ncbi:MAG: ABC transporter permease [Lachnospiraceae bacterium]|nr:ABC transporter permease [Lachnospiraceae bacterium]
MNITLSLALKQLKRKWSRTISTIAVIILSTALTTAVCNLVTSGNRMLVDLMGEDYASYGSSYVAILVIPAIILGLLILIMSVVVISNVFRISTGERLSQFGTLKCVGATGKQIIETVMYEAIFLCIVGIPLGILAGIGFTHIGVAIANSQLEELNSLMNMMMSQFHMSLDVILSWKALVLSGVISFFTVLYSASRPARLAAKKTAVACMKQLEVTGTTVAKDKKEKNSLLKGNIETGLAITNVRRNRRNTKSATTVLTISIILFICLSGLQDIAGRIEEYMTPDMKQTVIVDYTSNYDKRINPDTGRREVKFTNPIDADTANKITEQLKAYTDKDFLCYGNDYDTYFAMVPKELLSGDMEKALSYEKVELQDVNEFSVEILSVGQELYEELCERAGAKKGANILLNTYTYNYRGTEKRIVPWTDHIKSLNLELADGTPVEMKIGGELATEEIPEDLLFPNMNTVRLVVPNATVRGYSWFSSPDDIEDYMAYAEKVLDQYFPTGEDDEYMECGYSTRVYRVDDYEKVMNIAIMIACVFLYSFVIMLGIIGMINVISTMSTGITMRAREFAVLQSIGMTKEELEKMLNMESFLCAGKALLYGFPIGMVILMIINFAVVQMMPIGISVPWGAILLVFAVVFLVIWGTIHVSSRKLKDQNIIETIRM